MQQNRVKVYNFVIMTNHIHLLWQIQPGHKRENVQRDFLKYTAQKINFDLLENDKERLQQFKVDAKDRRYQIWERNPMSTDLNNHKAFLQKLENIPAGRRALQSCAGKMEFSWHYKRVYLFFSKVL